MTEVEAGDGWARSPAEVAETLARLGDQFRQIGALPGRTAADLTPGEHYVLGVRAGALWSTGREAMAPLTGEALPAGPGSALAVVSIAEYLIAAPDTPDTALALAAGVRAWLLWLAGVGEAPVLGPAELE